MITGELRSRLSGPSRLLSNRIIFIPYVYTLCILQIERNVLALTFFEVIIDVGTLKHLKHLLKTTRASSIVKETMWLLSNVLAGTHSQIDAVFSEDLLVNIVNVLKDGDSGSQSEAGWALSNLAVGGTTKQVMQIFKEGGLEAICSVLDTPNSELCSNLLDTLNNVLKIGKANDPMRFSNMLDRIEECGGLEKIEALQDHKSERIYKTAYHIIENFFDVAEEEKECRSEIDPVTDSQKFSF
ncbi:hypothetical protein AB6A40_007460 [Gnathostoma spinigerum]|uniref:Uncharacterized protein n=1 Tax=Gnathostoma spinigerum TaxID=75299 RepID=A0ABD6ELU0_9BILA